MGAFFSFYMNDCSNSKVFDDVDLELSPILKTNTSDTIDTVDTVDITHKHPAIL